MLYKGLLEGSYQCSRRCLLSAPTVELAVASNVTDGHNVTANIAARTSARCPHVLSLELADEYIVAFFLGARAHLLEQRRVLLGGIAEFGEPCGAKQNKKIIEFNRCRDIRISVGNKRMNKR